MIHPAPANANLSLQTETGCCLVLTDLQLCESDAMCRDNKQARTFFSFTPIPHMISCPGSRSCMCPPSLPGTPCGTQVSPGAPWRQLDPKRSSTHCKHPPDCPTPALASSGLTPSIPAHRHYRELGCKIFVLHPLVPCYQVRSMPNGWDESVDAVGPAPSIHPHNFPPASVVPGILLLRLDNLIFPSGSHIPTDLSEKACCSPSATRMSAGLLETVSCFQ